MRLIDADKLRLSYWVSPTSTVSTAGQYYFYSQAEIDNAPTIDAEPVRHGHWTRDYESSWGDSRFMCSVCHCKESVPTCNGEPSIWDYCPNCGAKMDEENDE